MMRRIAFTVGLALVLALGAAALFAPRMLLSLGESELRVAGFANGRIGRATLDLDGVRYHDVRGDPTGSLRADTVLIPWSRAMLRGQVPAATVHGARIAIAPGQPGEAPMAWGPPPAIALTLADAELSIVTDMGALVLALDAAATPAAGALRVAGSGTMHQVASPAFLPRLVVAIDANVTGEAVELTARLTGAGGIAATATGRVRPGGGDGELRFTSAPIRLGPATPIAALSPAAAALLDPFLRSPSGTVAIEGRLAWNRTGLESSARVTVTDLDFASDAGAVQDVNGTLAFARLDPPRLDGPQILRVRRVDAAVPLANLEIELRQNPAGVFVIGHVRAGALGGRIETGALTINEQRQRVAVRMTGINLNDVLALGAPEGLTGTGRLNGQVSIAVAPDGVILERGELTAAAPGRLAYAPRERPQLGTQAQILFDVLGDFHYDRLVITFARERGETAARLRIEGRNPAYQDGQRVNLNVNLSGELEQALQSALGLFRVPAEILRGVQSLERGRR